MKELVRQEASIPDNGKGTGLEHNSKKQLVVTGGRRSWQWLC